MRTADLVGWRTTCGRGSDLIIRSTGVTGSGSILQRNDRVKLAASFWNNVGAGMVIGGMAAAFFLDKPQGTWTKIGIAIAGLVLGWLCYSIASNILTYMHTVPE
jgi:phosphatidylglycerophosphate synthase